MPDGSGPTATVNIDVCLKHEPEIDYTQLLLHLCGKKEWAISCVPVSPTLPRCQQNNGTHKTATLHSSHTKHLLMFFRIAKACSTEEDLRLCYLIGTLFGILSN